VFYTWVTGWVMMEEFLKRRTLEENKIIRDIMEPLLNLLIWGFFLLLIKFITHFLASQLFFHAFYLFFSLLALGKNFSWCWLIFFPPVTIVLLSYVYGCCCCWSSYLIRATWNRHGESWDRWDEEVMRPLQSNSEGKQVIIPQIIALQ
jgi:hypothetical protein